MTGWTIWPGHKCGSLDKSRIDGHRTTPSSNNPTGSKTRGAQEAGVSITGLLRTGGVVLSEPRILGTGKCIRKNGPDPHEIFPGVKPTTPFGMP